MATLIDIRNALALQGRLDVTQLSQQLHLSPSLVNAMLFRLETMGKVTRVKEQPNDCLSGSCKSCPEGKACLREWWSLRE